MRVLVAEDHERFRNTLVQLLLAEPDLDVIGEAYTGQMAVALARQLAPDVILMDISLPVLSGIDATRAILREFPQMVVIGLSMYADSELGIALRQAGAKACVSKTFPLEAILTAIRRFAPASVLTPVEPAGMSLPESGAPPATDTGWMGGGWAPARSPAEMAVQASQPMASPIRVLLVADQPLFRKGLAQLLRQAPDLAIVGEVATGAAALDLMLTTWPPEIILMELCMPGMTGIEATRVIHAHYPTVRVLALSAADDGPADQAMQRAGAVACLSKAASSAELLALIRRHAQVGRGQSVAA
jgi:DNA-binding NarL/FixJ family response regulator